MFGINFEVNIDIDITSGMFASALFLIH